MGVAALLLVHGNGAAVRVGIEQEERLEVVFDAFADHIFPPGADLQQTGDGQQVFWGGFFQPERLLGPRLPRLLGPKGETGLREENRGVSGQRTSACGILFYRYNREKSSLVSKKPFFLLV